MLRRWSRIARCSVLLGDTVSARQALERVGGQEAEGEQANIQLLERFTRDAQAAFSGKDYRKVPVLIYFCQVYYDQCCGSGSGILCFINIWIRIRDEKNNPDPG